MQNDENIMEKSLIDKINYYAKKQREGTLTEEEAIEQKKCREQYLKEFKSNFKKILDNFEIVDDTEEAH